MTFPGSQRQRSAKRASVGHAALSAPLCYIVDTVVNLLRSLAAIDAVTFKAVFTIHAGDTLLAPSTSLRRGTRFASEAPNTCATFNASPTPHAISTLPAREQHSAPSAMEAPRYHSAPPHSRTARAHS